tara:strand:- start:39509 stop:40384 length:876 start_codon:yes stop_codon:yes gene_type:complete
MVFNNTFIGKVGNVNTPTSQSSDDVTEIESIAPGETFEHDGPVLVKKTIGKGAIVKIKNGGITVQGSVDDDVKITVKDTSTSDSITISGANSIISGNNMVIINGTIISGNNVQVNNSFSNAAENDQIPRGITLHEQVGDNVTLVSDKDIELKKDAGATLKAESDRGFESLSLGDNSSVQAQRDIIIDGKAGENTQLTSGRSIEVGLMLSGSSANAGRNFEAECVENSTINAGRNAEISKIMGTSYVNAGRNVESDQADETASISAGRKKEIGSVSAPTPKSGKKQNPGFIY